MGRWYIFPFFIFIFSSCEDPIFVQEAPEKIPINHSYTVRELIVTPADILWVVDNSPSMGKYHNNLMQNMDLFINNFTKKSQLVPWKIGLLSTDMSDNPYIGFRPGNRFDSIDANPSARFIRAISLLGITGAATEKSFDPIARTLKAYPDFLRKNSKLFIIIVSDEKEQSSQSVEDFLNFLKSLRPLFSISTYGIFEKPEEDCGSSSQRFKGSRYDRFIQLTRGLSYSICSDDYGLVLSAFGEDIAKKITTSKIYLNSVPITKTLQIFYDGRPVPSGTSFRGGFWLYNISENAIFFHDLSFLKEGNDTEKIKVTFEKMPLFNTKE